MAGLSENQTIMLKKLIAEKTIKRTNLSSNTRTLNELVIKGFANYNEHDREWVFISGHLNR